MVEVGQAALPPYRSAEEILAHPRFPAARNLQIDTLLALYEHAPFLNRLLQEAGRRVLSVVIMCLDARYDEADRTTWPTLQEVTRRMAAFSLGSPRRIADLVSRLIKTGYVAQIASPRDRRVRLLRPTEKMIAQDQDWLVSQYMPLQMLYRDPGYEAIIRRDPGFHRTHRLAAESLFPFGAELMARHPVMTQFMSREAGIMIVLKLIELARASVEAPRDISYSDIGTRFGVSRTQVRKLIQDADRDGLVRLTQRSGPVVQLTPALIEAVDRFLADAMAGNDLVYQLAQRATREARAP
jgi:DNA-binding MarR family transcriptional regulator